MAVRFIISALLVTGATAARWAVIAAGSSGYPNYRHQADACHAYQILKAGGVPPENIILFSYDDVAHAFQNPFKGKLFNRPDPTGNGTDVYAGCNIDYRGEDVTPQKFLGALTGQGSGKVLKSTAEDEVFVYFADHGAPGLIAFPSSELHVMDLQKALADMSTAKMFKKLTFYLEACESGSMFTGMNISGVYAVSAANARESSWGAYCGREAVVAGRHMNVCLGDLFSISWMEDVDSRDVSRETLGAQYQVVKARTNKSHVLQWGDVSFTADVVAEFIGASARPPQPASTWEDLSRGVVSARDADLYRLYAEYSTAEDSTERLRVAELLQQELARQQAAEKAYMKFVEIALPAAQGQHALTIVAMPSNAACELGAHQAFREQCSDKFDANSGFALQFHQLVVNVCFLIENGGLNLDHVAAVRAACGAGEEAPALVV